ncbi:branched-chain amino acid ABC transporter permease [Microbacterium hominis]|uniref:ABC transporter permease n=1 Tax=Microbacterium hominis TaxID=162426 RepID=A0A0B4DYS0_9MICO|nr:branched-chain amino acid ABC transporter permease [Microbacterium hominis]KIC59408.1 ABC transporter permease [Microbacterium hominis]
MLVSSARLGVHPRRRVALLVSLLFAAITLLAVLLPAQPAAAAAASCSADASTACVQGTIRQSDGSPAVGVGLTISGPGVGASPTTTTDSAGRWVFAVTKDGTYTVKVDAATLAQGQYLDGADSREVSVTLHSDVSAIFKLSDSPDGAAASASAFDWPRFWQQAVQGIRLGLLLALASLGLSLIFGTTGLSNFAHGELVTIGGVLAWFLTSLTGNLWLGGGLAVVVMAGLGWVQDAGLWKPLRRRRLSLTQMMIVSIGLSIALQYVVQLWIGAGTVRIDKSNPATVTIFGVTLTIQSYVAMGIAIVAIAAVGLGLMYTRFGRATRAVSDNPALASASGIDVDKVIRGVWILASGLAGLAGVLLGLVLNGIGWETGGQLLLLLFAAVTLGGLGTAFGAFAGAMVIGLIVELTNIWLPGDLKYATALALLIVILLFRPQGIFGRAERVG